MLNSYCWADQREFCPLDFPSGRFSLKIFLFPGKLILLVGVTAMRRLFRLMPLILVTCGCVYFSASNKANSGSAQDGESPIASFFSQRCSACHGVDGHPSRDN